MERRTKEETVAIFDELLSQMVGATNAVVPNDQIQNQTQEDSHSNSMEDQNQNETRVESGSQAGMERDSSDRRSGERVSISKRRVKSSDVPKSHDLIRPSSSASLNKGEEPDMHSRPPRAASVETELVFATLPKKKKVRGKWSVIKRISSPLSRSRRKSFNTPPTNHTPSTAHLSVTPSVPITIVADKEPTKQSSPEDAPRVAIPSMKSLVSQFIGEGPKVGVARKRRASVPIDECLNALKVMTTLSSNKECLSSLISYICLPKCVTK